MLSIIIPSKNEEKYIGNLLHSIKKQCLVNYEIIIADNKSTDNTLKVINQYIDELPIKIVEGGLPSVARNNGAKNAKYDLLLFIDSDIYIKNNYLIWKSIEILKEKNLDLMTCFLNSDIIMTKIMYFFSNIFSYLSKFDKPFATTQYFLIKKDVFNQLGGFDESVMHCEDYLLSKKVHNKKFGLVWSYVYSDDRRFKKMGYINFALYFLNSILNKNNINHFRKNINYWN